MVTVVAQYTGKSTNWEKVIYFLSLMSCSINKLKSHIIFTCFLHVFLNVFRFYMEKKFLLQEMVGGQGDCHPWPIFSVALIKYMKVIPQEIYVITVVLFLSWIVLGIIRKSTKIEWLEKYKMILLLYNKDCVKSLVTVTRLI